MDNQLRSFGLFMGSILGLYFAFRLGWREGATGSRIGLAVSMLFLVFGMVAPKRLSPVHRAWMLLAEALGWLNTRLILTAVFIFLVVPIALLARLFNREGLLDTRLIDEASSYWHERPKDDQGIARLERMF